MLPVVRRASLARALAALLAGTASAGEPAPLYASLAPAPAAAARLSTGGLPDAESLVEGALPPPPERVVLVTKGFGTVTVNHKAHLALRVHCAACHGPGPVTKLHPMQVRVAHERCIGCHRETEKAPQGCRGCHVVAPPAPAPSKVAAASTGAAAAVTLAAASPAAAAANPARAASSSAAGPAGGAPVALAAPGLLLTAQRERTGTRRVAELGSAVLIPRGRGGSAGPALRVALEDDGSLFTQSLESTLSRDGAAGRTVGLLGFGKSIPLGSRASLSALLVGGFDAVGVPSLTVMPAAGVRLGARLRNGWPFAHVISLEVTGLADLTRPRAAGGDSAGRELLGLGASVGVPLGDTR